MITAPKMKIWATEKIDSAKFAHHARRNTSPGHGKEMPFDGIPQPYRRHFELAARRHDRSLPPDTVLMSHDGKAAWISIGWKS